MQFVEQAPIKSATQIESTTWAAEAGPRDTFLVVRLKLQDLMNMHSGKVNFLGHEKPKLGTLEEHIDVFTATWVMRNGDESKPRMRPIVGNFNGGFQTLHEAQQICRDAWAQRARYGRGAILVPPAGGKSERILQ